MAENVPKKCKTYPVGGEASTGAKVTEIIVSGDKCFLFIDEDGDLGCEFEESTCVDGDLSVREAMDLYVQMKASGLPLRQVVQLVAAALSHALEDRHEGDTRDFFSNPRELLTTARLEQFQMIYLLTSFLATIVLALAVLLPILLVPSGAEDVLRAGAYGSVGALLSVLLRFKEVVIFKHSSKNSIVTEGIVRVVLGAVFGMLFLMLQKGGFLMTVAAGNVYATSCLAVVAGFSERLIPSLIENLEGRIGGKKGA